MNAATATDPGLIDSKPGQSVTVDQIIRHAHKSLEAAGQHITPSRVSRLVRKRVQSHGLADATRMVDSYIKAADSLSDFAGWCLSYNDPTGRTAARNVDRERGDR